MNYDPMKSEYPDLLEEWKKKGISTDSNYIHHFCNLAKELKVSICITYLRENIDGDPFNSISVINKEGDIVLTYDKVHTCSFSSASIIVISLEPVLSKPIPSKAIEFPRSLPA